MIGKFAISKAGHDKGQIYVVTAFDDRYVYLSDGRRKSAAKPKKKSIRHIQIVNRKVEEELLSRLINKEPHVDEEVKYAIKQYTRTKQ